jgi:hypothetical protein
MIEQLPPILKEFEKWLTREMKQDTIGDWLGALDECHDKLQELKRKYGYD